MTAIRPTPTTVPPTPRPVALLVAAVVLAGASVGFVNEIGLTLILYLPNACVGALLVIRRPRNLIGWLLIGIGWAFVGGFVPVPAAAESFKAGTASPLALLIAWWNSWSWFTAFALYLFIMIIFPAGHLPSGRWRRPAAVAIAAASFAVVLMALAPTIDVHPHDGSGQTLTIASPLSLLPDSPLWSLSTKSLPIPVFVLMCLLTCGVVSMVVRVRRARGLLRQQLRWMVAALSAVTAAVIFGVMSSVIFGDAVPEVALIPVIVTFPLPAVAIGIAILRYRLYEIDRIVSRTIAFAGISAILIAAYAGAILILQGPLGAVLGGETISVALSTLFVAALFQPIRRRAQRAVDGRFDRARFDAELTTAAFAERLRDEVEIAAVLSDLDTTVRSSLKPTLIGLWVRKRTA